MWMSRGGWCSDPYTQEKDEFCKGERMNTELGRIRDWIDIFVFMNSAKPRRVN